MSLQVCICQKKKKEQVCMHACLFCLMWVSLRILLKSRLNNACMHVCFDVGIFRVLLKSRLNNGDDCA